MEEKKERSMAKNAAFQLTAGGSAGNIHCQAQVQVKGDGLRFESGRVNGKSFTICIEFRTIIGAIFKCHVMSK